MPNTRKIRTLDAFLALLQGVKNLGSGRFTAKCPAHNHNNKPLHITYKKGNISLLCDGGCLRENVTAVMNLAPDDLNLNSGGFGAIDPDWDKQRDNAEIKEPVGITKEPHQSTVKQAALTESRKSSLKPNTDSTGKCKELADGYQDQTPQMSKTIPPVLISGAELLDKVVAYLLRYIVLTHAQADTLALWTLHTHTFESADATPYINITSPEKQSGKTRVLEVEELLVNRPWFTARTTAAVLARKIDKEKPTLLLDESDAAFNGDKEYAETLRGILNSGHRRGGKTSVCIGQGAKIDYKDLSTFCPKAIAGIGKLPDTVSDRSITIILKRRTSSEPIERFRRKKASPEAELLRDSLAALVVTLQLTGAEPDLPQELDDRAQDGWEPLLAIADAVGGDWPQRARKAAIDLSCGGVKEDQSLGIRLLADIKSIFEENSADWLPSNELVGSLISMEDAPWADLDHKQLTSNKMARLLKSYEIKPHDNRQGRSVRKGYEKQWFIDAWNRYLPSLSGNQTATRATLATIHTQPQTATFPQNKQDVADDIQYQVSLDVADVAVQKGDIARATVNADRNNSLPPLEPPVGPTDGSPPDVLEPWEEEAGVWYDKDGNPNIGDNPEAN